MTRFLLLTVLALFAGFTPVMAEETAESGVVLQILGSGGPFGGDKRASAGYLVWVNDHARVMIDAGGGTFLRLQQSGAQLQDVYLLGLTHFHFWPESGLCYASDTDMGLNHC